MPSPIDDATLQMALIGYQAELSRIERQMAEIRGLLGGRVDPVVAKKATPKRVLSVAARARIAAGQKKRWAAFHKGKDVAAAPELPMIPLPLRPPGPANHAGPSSPMR